LKHGHHRRIEMAARVLLKNRHDRFEVHRRLVGTLGAQRVIHVGHGEDARRQRYRRTFQLARVTRPVPLLVMRGDHGIGTIEPAHPGDNGFTLLDVSAHDG